MQNAIGLLEVQSIARGVQVCDAMLKTSAVELIEALALCPGKYVILVAGEVAAVQSAVDQGRETAGELLVHELVIPNLHPQVVPALSATTQVPELRALGTIETFSVASAISAADSAVKAANVDLIEIRLAKGLGGKAYVFLTGEVAAVQAAVDAGKAWAEAEGMLVGISVIPNPHKDLRKAIL